MPNLIARVGEILFPILLREILKKTGRKVKRRLRRSRSIVHLSEEDLNEIEEMERLLQEEDEKRSHVE